MNAWNHEEAENLFIDAQKLSPSELSQSPVWNNLAKLLIAYIEARCEKHCRMGKLRESDISEVVGRTQVKIAQIGSRIFSKYAEIDRLLSYLNSTIDHDVIDISRRQIVRQKPARKEASHITKVGSRTKGRIETRDISPQPIDHIIATEHEEILRDKLRRLDERHTHERIFDMLLEEDQTQPQMAARIGMDERTVRKYVARVRSVVSREIEDQKKAR